jgi:hypothetical protein
MGNRVRNQKPKAVGWLGLLTYVARIAESPDVGHTGPVKLLAEDLPDFDWTGMGRAYRGVVSFFENEGPKSSRNAKLGLKVSVQKKEETLFVTKKALPGEPSVIERKRVIPPFTESEV